MTTPPSPTTPSSASDSTVHATLARLFLAVIALIGTAAVLEVGARVYLTRFASEWTFRRYASYSQLVDRYGPRSHVFTPHPYLGYALTSPFEKGANRHNTLGYRGAEIVQPKPDHVFRIVCIGGSTTYTSEVEDYRLSYPAQLEKRLRANGYVDVEVVNAGVPGWTSWESLINFELRVLDLDPDLIVVYDALNDVGSRLVWPPTAYRGDKSGSVALETGQVTLSQALELSTVARMVLIRLGKSQSAAGLSTLATAPATYYGDEFDQQAWSASYPSGLFAETPVSDILRHNPPVYFRPNTENLVALAKARGIGVVLSTFAHLSLAQHDRRSSWDSPEYWSAIAEHNAVTRSIAKETSVGLVDLATLLPQDPGLYANVVRNGRDFIDIYHVNARGAEQQANLIANFLAEQHLVPMPPAGTASTR